MAKECRNVIGAIDLVKVQHSDNLMINQLDNARNHLEHAVEFLEELEKVHPENRIISKLRPLFIEACNGFSKVCSPMKDQGWMSSKGLKSERLKASRRSTSTSKVISQLLKIITPENIAEQIKASKPSRSSSSQITMEIVGFVEALLDCTASCICHYSVRQHALSSRLKKKLKHLQLFIMLAADRCIEHESMEDLFAHAEDVAYNAAQLFFLGFSQFMDREFSVLLERISPFRPELRKIYMSAVIGLKSSRLENPMSAICTLDFVSALQKDLRLELDDRISFLRRGLSNLIVFFQVIESDSVLQGGLISLKSHFEFLAIEAATVIWFAYDEEMNKATEISEHVIFPLQLKFNHFEVVVSLINLLNCRATVITPLKDLADYVLEELVYLGTFLIDSLEQCKEQTKITDFLSLIQSVTHQAWSFIESHYHDSEQEYLARKFVCLHFQLLLKFKFIKAVIRQMCPDISASSTPDHPMINLLNFLPINFWAIDSYLYKNKSSKMDLFLMEFQEYILDKLLLRCETNMPLTVANKIGKFYDGLLLLVTYSVDPLGQCSERKKQNNLLPAFGSKVIEAYKDASDSNKSRKVNLVVQFLIESIKFVDYEARLMDLIKHKALKAQILALIKIVHEELIFLVVFLMDVLSLHTELNKFRALFMCAEVTAQKLVQISGFCFESLIDVGSTEKLRLSLSDYLQGVEPVKVEIRKICIQFLDASPCNMTDGEGLINFLLNQQKMVLGNESCSISFLKNQIPVVKDKLVYLGSFLADIVQYHDMHQELKALVKRVQDMKYVCLFPMRDYRPAWYYMLYLSDAKQLLWFVEAEVKGICHKVPDSSSYIFPKTNGLGFLNCFLGKLDDLLRSKLDSVIDLKHQIGSVKEGLLCLRSRIDHIPKGYDEDGEVYSLITSVTKMAYKAEYVIDSCLACSHPLWYKVIWVRDVVENIKLVSQVVSETCERKKIDVTMYKVKKSNDFVPSLSATTPRANEEKEGFQEALNQMKKQLLGGSPQLDVISLVGMPGIGKTTLAEKIYNDPKITCHFDVHAKCRVTQVYSWRELMLTILNDVREPADRTEKGDGEIADELRRFLSTKRFLILIDDVWDYNAWDSLHMCFKDARNRSRIILTTRLSDVANYASSESNPHHLRLFTDDESWILLQEEVFQGESCPPELKDVGFRLAKCCGGLPLFIVLVAGILKEKEKRADLWKEVEERLGAQNMGSLGESMPIIGFSYKNLPHYLKPCFLYLGGLLKGKDIHVSKLARLWLSEGFVQASEDVAQDFLEDLISRNLLMGMKKRPNGKVKMCRIHDMLHQFCLEKAKQENFLLQINRFSGEDALPEKPKEYRLFIYSSQDQIDSWQPFRSNVRSLIFHLIDLDSLLWPRDISFIFDSFKLVKVLDLESFNIGGTFPSEIQSLIHMRYFAVQTDANSIPSSIAKLWNLETFVVRGLGGEVILPSSILKMVKLRHILVKHRASFSLHESMGESLALSQLDNLVSFSTPRLSYGGDAETILKRMPNLRKLSCIFSGTFGCSEKVKGRCVLFPTLEFLSHLESLKLVSNSYPAKLPHVFNFPSRLRELTLSKFRLPWSQILTIEELPNLEILKLLLRAFEGDEWNVKDTEFPKLKYLELDDLNIARWSISEDAFPMLERLVLTKCKQLKEIPYHFGDAVSLRSIEVNWCNWSVANSAQEIQTTQHEDMANDAFTVVIQPSDWARGSSS